MTPLAWELLAACLVAAVMAAAAGTFVGLAQRVYEGRY